MQPELSTERLLLRPFLITDAPAVATLAGDEEVARNTLNIPHPYIRTDAEDWITSHPGQYERREAVTYAVIRTEDGTLVGAIGLILDTENQLAELGYWIGRDFWGQGFATEAARGVLAWAFDALQLNRVHASHFPRNPASGRVLQKLGMRREGRFRQHVNKWGTYLDLELYGLLKEEFDGPDRTSPNGA